MDELTTPIVSINCPNEDKSNWRMECMPGALGDAIELHLEPTNPYDDNAVAISARAARSWAMSALRSRR
jgi:hypothetical protein